MLTDKRAPNGISDSRAAIAQIEVAWESINVPERRPNDRTQRTQARNLENGVNITTVPPVRHRCGLFSIASFDPRRIPKAIISENLGITVEDYIAAMEKLINDSRFRIYWICHQRIVLIWIICSFLLMLLLLDNGRRGIGLFALIVAWMILVCVGVAISLFLNKVICKNLAVCVAAVNEMLSRFDLLLCVDDRGKFSCNDITIVFLHFNLKNCVARTCGLISRSSAIANSRRLNVSSISASVDMWTEQIRLEQAKLLLLRYSQQYCRDLVRGVIRFPAGGRTMTNDLLLPLHCSFAQCPCQYVERNFFLRREASRWVTCCA